MGRFDSILAWFAGAPAPDPRAELEFAERLDRLVDRARAVGFDQASGRAVVSPGLDMNSDQATRLLAFRLEPEYRAGGAGLRDRQRSG
jgi:hypothetical protein